MPKTLIRKSLIHKLAAFAFVVLIGTNVAGYYSDDAPFQGGVILAGAAYFSFFFPRRFFQILFCREYLLTLFLLTAPIFLMLIAQRSFDRGVYSSAIFVVLVFTLFTVLASKVELVDTLRLATFTIVAVGAVVNGYELFVENNVFSLSPGRSAGFYVNPNTSAEALLGYGLVFFSSRLGKFRLSDLLLIGLVILGVATTFSRSGIISALILLSLAVFLRVDRKRLPTTFAGIFSGAIVVVLVAMTASASLDFSEDAELRLQSLLERGGVGDYVESRGIAAVVGLELSLQNFVLGSGVGTVAGMELSPHNMFVAILLNYGLVGLSLFLTLLGRLAYIAFRARRDLSLMISVMLGWIVLFGFSSHNLLETTPTIPFLSVAMARVWEFRRQRRGAGERGILGEN